MDTLTLSTFLIPILTVTTVWNTGETGDIYELGSPLVTVFPGPRSEMNFGISYELLQKDDPCILFVNDI